MLFDPLLGMLHFEQISSEMPMQARILSSKQSWNESEKCNRKIMIGKIVCGFRAKFVPEKFGADTSQKSQWPRTLSAPETWDLNRTNKSQGYDTSLPFFTQTSTTSYQEYTYTNGGSVRG